DGGGKIVAAGTPEDVAKVAGSYTGKFLKPILAKTKTTSTAKKPVKKAPAKAVAEKVKSAAKKKAVKRKKRAA
ncbi:MAG: hypothetical protein KDA48_14690, partial [Amphiplicatus sp.]|nr:hypothetical protein [Amphiplicatus sp.]